MVRHPRIGVDRQPMLGGRLDQGIAKELVVRLCGKDRLAVIAALDDVLRLTGNDVTGKARHECSPRMKINPS